MSRNVFQCTEMCVSMCTYLPSNPYNLIPIHLNNYFMFAYKCVPENIYVYPCTHIYKVCTKIIGFAMQRNAFTRFWSKALMAF